MSVALAIVGVSVLGTWGIATISLIVGGIILIVAPADIETTSSGLAVGVFLLIAGLISGGLMQVIAMPLMGLDPPLPVKASSIIPHDRMKGWASAGPLRAFPDGIATEVRLHSFRVAIVRQGEEAYAMAALCSHARLPLGSFPGAPIKPEPVRDGCVMCPFHGARFEVANGKIWVNGTEVYSFYSQIGFIKMNDGFAERLPIRLQEGWNAILVKIESAFPAYNTGLVFRLTDEDGFPAPGLRYAKRPQDPDALVRERRQGVVRDTMRFLPPFPTYDQRQGRFGVTHGKERWYRLEVPPGTTAFLVPARPAGIAVYLNGTRVQPDSAGRVTFPALDFDRPASIALRLPADRELLDYLQGSSGFRVGERV